MGQYTVDGFWPLAIISNVPPARRWTTSQLHHATRRGYTPGKIWSLQKLTENPQTRSKDISFWNSQPQKWRHHGCPSEFLSNNFLGFCWSVLIVLSLSEKSPTVPETKILISFTNKVPVESLEGQMPNPILSGHKLSDCESTVCALLLDVFLPQAPIVGISRGWGLDWL